MKKFLISLLLMLPLAFSANAQQKIGVVNTSAIMEALPDVKAATTKIQDLAKQYDSEIKRMQDELKVKLEAYQKEEASMTTSSRSAVSRSSRRWSLARRIAIR